MAFVRRVSLFRREIRESISPAALDVLLSSAGRISEGQLSGERYYGSTMLTIDLTRIQGRVRDVCDVATAARLSRHMNEEQDARGVVRRIALEEACRVAGRQIALLEAEVRVRAEGQLIYVDVDLEGAAGTSVGRGASRSSGSM
jgi:hypothetical protein